MNRLDKSLNSNSKNLLIRKLKIRLIRKLELNCELLFFYYKYMIKLLIIILKILKPNSLVYFKI